MADAGCDLYGDTVLKLVHDPDPRPVRAQAYPNQGDQLDALWKIVDALLNRQTPPVEALAVYAQVKAVKERWKKKDAS